MDARLVEIHWEAGQLPFDVHGVPEKDVVKILPASCADQTFHKRVGNGVPLAQEVFRR